MKKILLSIVLLIAPILLFLVYMGGFSNNEIVTQEFKARSIIFDIHRGSYTGLTQSWEGFKIKYQDAGLKECDALGVYLDPPSTEEDKLRTVMACDLTNVSEDIQIKLKNKFNHTQLTQSSASYTSFPYKNEMSFVVASIFVYSKFQEMIEAGQLHPSIAIEVYGVDEGRSEIKFYMPSDKTPEDYSDLFQAFTSEGS